MRIRMIFFSSLFFVLSITLLPACGSRQQSATHRFEVSNENGVPVAISTGGPSYNAPVFSFEFLFRLEQDESREETLLFGFNWYMVGEDGRFYVTDTGSQRIVIFDSDGKYSHSLGRGGQEPATGVRRSLSGTPGLFT